jgi:hypothetical protein
MDKTEKTDQVGTLFNNFHDLHTKFGKLWLSDTFLHWDWWLALLFSIAAWGFWIFYHKKESTHRLLYAGVFVILISLFLDYIGVAMGLWYYSGKLTPSFPAWMPFNFCMLPVTIMFLIQTKPHIAAWKKGIFYGALTSYVGEPIFVWLGFYVLTGWKYSFSVPIYALIYIFAEWLTKRDAYSNV